MVTFSIVCYVGYTIAIPVLFLVYSKINYTSEQAMFYIANFFL